MHQTSRHFATLTGAFHAEGGTVDKFVGDSVMLFWNAPHLQPDHVDLSAKAASEALNAQFAAEGLRLSPLASDHLETFYCTRHLGTHWS
jgi:adenylate cyclase